LKYRGAYNASKYALEALSDTMRLELAGTNIHIALIEPGPIVSAFRQNAATHFHRQIDTDTSAHHDAYVRMQEAWSKGASMPFALEPKAVYKNLLHALNARRPKLRYRVTIPTIAFWYLKRLLPCAWLDNILTRV
jgi:short-subunit dehydrogenase